MDVKSAFLIGELQEDVFVEQEDLSITSPPLPVVLVIHAQGYLQIDRHVFFFACFVFSLTCAEHQLVVCRAFRRPWCWTSSPTSTPASEYPDRQTPDEKNKEKKTQHHGCCSILRSSFLSTNGSKFEYLLPSRSMLSKYTTFTVEIPTFSSVATINQLDRIYATPYGINSSYGTTTISFPN